LNDRELSQLTIDMWLKKAQIKKIKAEVEEMRAMILVELKTRDIENFDTDNDLRLAYKKQTRNKLDKIALEEYLIEKNTNLQRFQEETEYELLSIKEV